MRKQRQRERHGRSPGKDEALSGDEGDPAVEHSDAVGEDVTETEAGQGAGSPDGSVHDLDSLGRELARSLSGTEARTADASQTTQARGETPPPPSRNATPEDILGLQTRSFEELEPTAPADAQTELPSKADVAREAPGSPPMDEFEERAAMAKEVLRATSDHERSARRNPPDDVGIGDATGEAEEQIADEDVRFSEDVTISANKRPRRKLFGR